MTDTTETRILGRGRSMSNVTPRRRRAYWCPACKRRIVRMGRVTHRAYCEETGRNVRMRQVKRSCGGKEAI